MKIGDRIRTKGLKLELEGIIAGFEEDRINITLDKPLSGGMQSGYMTKKEFSEIFEIIEKSDWASLWDDAAED